MDGLPVLAAQVVFSLAAGAMCIVACRVAGRAWAPLGLVVSLALLMRAWLGLALVLASYYKLGGLASLHTGDGFWGLAPDARTYYELAASTPVDVPLPATAPSPAFVEMLRLWMRIAGVGLASPVLFNLLLYAGLAVMLIAAFRPLRTAAARLGALVTLSAFSFSPVLILLGTQALKDVLFTFLVACGAVALFLILPVLGGRPRLLDLVFCAGIVGVAVTLIAGIRPYYAGLILLATGIAILVRLQDGPWVRRRRVLRTGAALVALIWCAFVMGAGPMLPVYYANVISHTFGAPIALEPGGVVGVRIAPHGSTDASGPTGGGVQSLRAGFERAGGATNLVTPVPGEPQDAARQVLNGVAAVFVPISVMRALSIAQFSGGRGMIVATDIDTMFLDLSLVAVAWLTFSCRGLARRHAAFICFGLTLSIMSAVLIGYVVTNYGTLFRLRLIATVPIWMLPLSLTGRARDLNDFDGNQHPSVMQRSDSREVLRPHATDDVRL